MWLATRRHDERRSRYRAVNTAQMPTQLAATTREIATSAAAIGEVVHLNRPLGPGDVRQAGALISGNQESDGQPRSCCECQDTDSQWCESWSPWLVDRDEALLSGSVGLTRLKRIRWTAA